MIRLHLQTLSYADSVASGDRDLLNMIDLAGDLRLDGVDFEDRQFRRTDNEYLESLRLKALQRGLGIGYIGIQAGFGQGFHGDDDGYQRHIEEWIDIAARMRVPMLRVIGGNVPDDGDEEAAWPALTARMGSLTDYARRRNVIIGLHNHNHGMFPATGTQVVRMLDEIDDPYFVHILDTGQYRGSPGASGVERCHPDPLHDLYEHIRTSAPRATGVRVKIYRIATGVEEFIDYHRVMTMLRDVGYNGWMSIVYEGGDVLDPEQAIPKAVAHLRGLLDEYGI